jgi:dTDP-4-amino-4,6-dideoxygalactose transaminase
VATFPFIRPDIPPAAEWVPLLDEAYRVGRFSNYGPISLRLERLVAGAWGGPDTVCVAASSGTAAIAAPLLAGGVTGRVILPAFTFVATLVAVRMAGAEPILVDVDPGDWRIAPQRLHEALLATGARSAVTLAPFGMRSDFSAHAAIVAERGGLLVVDNAAGLGTARAPIETAPHCYEACSLHATKPLAIGEGGMVFAHRSREDALRRALNFGLRPGPVPDLRGGGINGKLSELHAAVGIAAVERFPARLERRQRLAARYRAVAARVPGVRTGAAPEEGTWQFFPLLLPGPRAAERFAAAAADRGMETRRYYVPSLSSLDDVERFGPCPVSEDLSARMCCVPVYADADAEEEEAMLAVFARALAAALDGPPA